MSEQTYSTGEHVIRLPGMRSVRIPILALVVSGISLLGGVAPASADSTTTALPAGLNGPGGSSTGPARVPQATADVPWTRIGHAYNVVGMAAVNNKLFAADVYGGLWWRDPVGYEVSWTRIGHAYNVVGMTASNNKLFAADVYGGLWWRDPVQ
ncbi:MAG TPA: hypothetical protein VMU51_08805 [Mycobacteriales bacterium]|nr:hypothetical protein [Mycobacteriales bacterium]